MQIIKVTGGALLLDAGAGTDTTSGAVTIRSASAGDPAAAGLARRGRAEARATTRASPRETSLGGPSIRFKQKTRQRRDSVK